MNLKAATALALLGTLLSLTVLGLTQGPSSATSARTTISLAAYPHKIAASGARKVALVGRAGHLKKGAKVTIQANRNGRWHRLVTLKPSKDGRFAAITGVGATTVFRAVTSGATDKAKVVFTEFRGMIQPGPVPNPSTDPLACPPGATCP